MPTTANKAKTPKVPAWFHQKPNSQQRQQFKDATVQFIIDKKLRNKLPKPIISTYRDIIRWVRATDEKWYDVNKDNFSPTLYPAHQSLQDTIRNLLNSQRELPVLLDEAEERERETREAENSASQIEDVPDDQQEQPLDVDNILRQDQVHTPVPPLPGSSEQRSTKAAAVEPTVGQKRAKPVHFADREHLEPLFKEFKDSEIEPLWHAYLIKKAAKVVAEKEAMEAEQVWSEACMKFQSKLKDN